MCLTGVDYFSTLGYQPGIAALAAGALSPIATLVLVGVTLVGALPMYRRVAEESPHGDGSLSMLERLLTYWPSKLLVLCLLGFVATGFVITMTLSGADAAAHLVENPLLAEALHGQNVAITLGLIALLAVVFLIGFSEAIGVAVVLVVAYLGLSAVVIGNGLTDVFGHPERLANWWAGLQNSFGSPVLMLAAAMLVFPALALGLSGFETGVVVMPLVKGDPGDTPAAPRGRIRNAKKLLTCAAAIMSVMLLGSATVTTLLIPAAEFWPSTSITRTVNTADLDAGLVTMDMPMDAQERPGIVLTVPVPGGRSGSYTIGVDAGGETVQMSVVEVDAGSATTIIMGKPAGGANGRALAFLAHERLGEGFGTVYDVATIGILWFAGASAMAGLLNIVPRYLPRYGMAPEWARSTRPLVVLFTLVAAVVTIVFQASVDRQAGAYATGVLALMSSAAFAVFLTEARRRHRGAAVGFLVVTLIFVYTSVVTISERPEGLWIAAIFIGTIIFFSVLSRISRSTELRVKRVILEPQAEAIFARWAAAHPGPLRFIANKLDAGDRAEYDEKDYDVRAATHLGANDPAIFLEVAVADASEFSGDVVVGGELVGRHAVLRARGVAVPNTLAAIMLEVARQTAVPPHIYFAWSERGPAENAMLFLIGGGGDIPPLTHEILRVAEPDPARRPLVHVGG
ncbi:amino acid transporter [Micropruina sonneratiae]|uniref:amino acid transporter n=1 Tax=Micropruina sonneratiae TaxID=2986940 RepID=UPI0039B6F995